MNYSKTNIGELFDRIAGHYDGLNHLLSLNVDKRWRRQAVRSLPGNSQSCLDVATGTGDLAIAIVRAGKAQNVTGIDLSDNMMAVGKRKVASLNLSDKITFLHADCASLPFDDDTFNAVTCSYGVRNFAQLDKSLSEMYRVTAPGGELRILEFAYPTSFVMRHLYDFYFTRLLPVVGRIVSHDSSAYDYLPRSVKGFIWGDDFLSHLRKAGFSATSFKSQTFGISMLYKATKL
ncbi:MAG: bifunctional demethylmenaquinone methyltransferase/2-methoxy-6-polyprenyl-1,4-benzoquinol methylase UbiE [Paludibacteraceae bacterium]|nr:bifunctional demethylmenaquinone methyltransferase/2-methoxy-6-polyprenyl-1,4-benzoquinol methylase UbiE [Paludibacteraceae bacterium]